MGFPGWWFVSPIIFINSPRALFLSLLNPFALTYSLGRRGENIREKLKRCFAVDSLPMQYARELEPDPEHTGEYFLGMAWVGGWFERTIN